jgi:hypothetical protein
MPGYTRIEDLPDLDAGNNQNFDAVGAGGDDEYRQRDINKFIRNNNRMIPSGAGMGREGPPGLMGGPPMGGPPMKMMKSQEMMEQPVMDIREMRYVPPAQHSHERPDPMSLNCVDVAMHIQECPICSKFYNGDKSLYVIVIVILAIICLLLLKRVLNV